MPDPRTTVPRDIDPDRPLPLSVPAAGIATVDGRPFFPQAGRPHDRCFRCGRATPLGVSLCDADNPAHIGAPSTTQVHGTIIAGILIGFVIFALAAKLAITSGGPFVASLTGRIARTDGAVDVVLQVTNQGSRLSAATCRIGKTSAATPEDVIFLTEPIQGGATASLTHTLPTPGDGDAPWAIDRIAVACT